MPQCEHWDDFQKIYSLSVFNLEDVVTHFENNFQDHDGVRSLHTAFCCFF